MFVTPGLWYDYQEVVYKGLPNVQGSRIHKFAHKLFIPLVMLWWSCMMPLRGVTSVPTLYKNNMRAAWRSLLGLPTWYHITLVTSLQLIRWLAVSRWWNPPAPNINQLQQLGLQIRRRHDRNPVIVTRRHDNVKEKQQITIFAPLIHMLRIAVTLCLVPRDTWRKNNVIFHLFN